MKNSSTLRNSSNTLRNSSNTLRNSTNTLKNSTNTLKNSSNTLKNSSKKAIVYSSLAAEPKTVTYSTAAFDDDDNDQVAYNTSSFSNIK